MKKKKRSALYAKEARRGIIFIVPWLIGFVLFFLFPIVFSLVLSFSDITNLTTLSFKLIGWQNYSDALLVDIDFLPKLMTSLYDSIIKTPIIVVFSLFIAILLNRKIPMKGVFRVLFLLPIVIGTGTVLNTLQGNSATLAFSPQGMETAVAAEDFMINLGALEMSDRLAMFLGKDLAGIVETVLGYISDSLWTAGIQIIFFLGALQGIPDMYYEAAACDGASEWEKFWKITLPMIIPEILIVVIYTLVSYFTSEENEVMTYVVNTTFSNLNLDYGSAMGWIYYLAIGLILGLVFLIFRRAIFYAGDR